MVNEVKKDLIRKEARKIIDGFAKTLESLPKAKAIGKEGSLGRVEGSGMSCDDDFRARMFENAPKKNKDFLIAEKGAWS